MRAEAAAGADQRPAGPRSEHESDASPISPRSASESSFQAVKSPDHERVASARVVKARVKLGAMLERS
ncbi:MAG: hypothetical protein WAL22_06235, partial [Solirubrobacteraceae bacterium]